MSEGNSIYDGPNMGDENELDSWADHPEPNEDEATELHTHHALAVDLAGMTNETIF